jgi:hypothetical protein
MQLTVLPLLLTSLAVMAGATVLGCLFGMTANVTQAAAPMSGPMPAVAAGPAADLEPTGAP